MVNIRRFTFMSNKRLFRNAALTVSILASSTSLALAQDPKPTQDPSTKARNFKAEVKKVYQDWINKDVEYIITSDEKKAFKTLKTDEERENFIENFWRRRDPDPDTEENEFREEYYERIAYA
jgi:hypothetical protein